jgi:hypothetical protein
MMMPNHDLMNDTVPPEAIARCRSSIARAILRLSKETPCDCDPAVFVAVVGTEFTHTIFSLLTMLCGPLDEATFRRVMSDVVDIVARGEHLLTTHDREGHA